MAGRGAGREAGGSTTGQGAACWVPCAVQIFRLGGASAGDMTQECYTWNSGESLKSRQKHRQDLEGVPGCVADLREPLTWHEKEGKRKQKATAHLQRTDASSRATSYSRTEILAVLLRKAKERKRLRAEEGAMAHTGEKEATLSVSCPGEVLEAEDAKWV